jgi:hypothetical protein
MCTDDGRFHDESVEDEEEETDSSIWFLIYGVLIFIVLLFSIFKAWASQ